MKFFKFALKKLSGTENLTRIKGHNSITNMRKMMLNNSNLALVNMKAYIIFGESLSSNSQDI